MVQSGFHECREELQHRKALHYMPWRRSWVLLRWARHRCPYHISERCLVIWSLIGSSIVHLHYKEQLISNVRRSAIARMHRYHLELGSRRAFRSSGRAALHQRVEKQRQKAKFFFSSRVVFAAFMSQAPKLCVLLATASPQKHEAVKLAFVRFILAHMRKTDHAGKMGKASRDPHVQGRRQQLLQYSFLSSHLGCL